MTEQTFVLPDVGEGLTEAEIVQWRVAPGDEVAVNDVLVEIETAKSLVELPSPYAGVVSALLVPEGEMVPVGTPIIRIDDYSGSVGVRSDRSVPAGAEPAPDPEPETVPDPVPASSAVDDIVVIAVDDDLPDPVYVEGSLDQGGSRSIVFIEDDDTGDTTVPDTGRDTRRGIEPRMRERRVAVKRAKRDISIPSTKPT